MVSGAFHELGHATASRYAGAEPGVIGAGIYLLWPVFYNDLNDSYRLSRTDRLRCDLGGVYFNVLFILALFVAFGLTGFTPLLVVAAAQHLVILQQFLPFVRLDGYYVVSDLAGVPDLFRRIRPVLASLVPGAAGRGDLKPHARRLVTAWVLLTVPLLAASLVYLGVPPAGAGEGHGRVGRLAGRRHREWGAGGRGARRRVAAGPGHPGDRADHHRRPRRPPGADPEVTRRIAKAVLTFGAPR